MFQEEIIIKNKLNKLDWKCFIFFENKEYIDSKLLKNIKNLLILTINKININKKGYIYLNVVSKKTMKDINNKIYPFKEYSDVLSINLNECIFNTSYENPLGEIYICYDKAKEQAKEYCHSDEREFAFLFLHGFLHLLKFDHINEKDEKIMFNLQEFILNKLNIKR